MKPILLTVAAVLLVSAVSFPAEASLGGTVASVQADQKALHGTLEATTKSDAYTVQEMKSPNGVVVREYVSTAGQVFAIAWQGPMRPDMQQLLGSYFQTFRSAVQVKRAGRVVRGPMTIKEAGLVVQMAGHMRWLVGRAYVETMVPSNVQLEEIR